MAFFHTELSRDGPGLLLRDILSGDDPQTEAIARVVRAVRPDVLVLAGIDWDLEDHALTALADRIGGYQYRFSARPNRGVPSGEDLDRDGRVGGVSDAHGFADFPGQEGLAVLSTLPIDTESLRNFTPMRWQDLPGALPPPNGRLQGRLSTTAHWDLPVTPPDGRPLSLMIWHATPPVFDGPEDRNGRRNHDEAAFWLRYLDGVFGTVPDRFVLLGAANLDTVDGDGRPEALAALLSDPRVQDVRPASFGAVLAAQADGGVNATHRGDPTLDTVDWPDEAGRPGNLRVDYVLPSAGLTVTGAGVFWPAPEESFGGDVQRASRHRLVWVDIKVGAE